MLSRELDAPVVSSGVKALHEEAMERAQGHTRGALMQRVCNATGLDLAEALMQRGSDSPLSLLR